MGRVQIDWATARVREGKLSVALAPAPSPKWRARAKHALALLSSEGHPPADVAIKKDRIVVAAVAEGAQDDVRFFLESIVLQANGPTPPDDAGDDSPDARMTAAFQAFGADA